MNSFLKRSRSEGYSLVEMMVVGLIVMMFALVGYPAFNNWIDKARIQAVVRSAATRMQVARQESITMNATVVAQPDLENDEIVFFVNVDGDSDFEFNPDPEAVHKTADYELSRMKLPEDYGIQFWAPTDRGPEGSDVVEGLTETSAAINAVVFQPDGSVRDEGAVRIADSRENFFEIRVAPRTTGRVQILKYHPSPPWGDDAAFFLRGRHPGSNSPTWVWF